MTAIPCLACCVLACMLGAVLSWVPCCAVCCVLCAVARYAPGPGHLDWASQPDPFRRYVEGCVQCECVCACLCV